MWGGRGSGFSDSHSVPVGVPQAANYGPIASLIGWNANATGDAVLANRVPWTNAIIESIYFTNASASEAASILVATLRDAAAGGGNSLGTVTALTGLTSAPLAVQQLLTVARRITTGALFLNTSVASAVVATIDVYVFGRILG